MPTREGTTNGFKRSSALLGAQIRKVFDIVSALPTMQVFKNIEELDEYLDVMQKKVKSGADPNV